MTSHTLITCATSADARAALDRGANALKLNYLSAHLDMRDLRERAPSATFTR